MRFKIIILTLFAIIGISTTASAQSWSDFLSGLFGGTTSQTETKVPETYPASLVGVWKYSAPAVVFTGDDIVATLGSSVASTTIKDQMSAYYTKAGVTPQTCTLQFRKNGKFEVKATEHKIDGHYSYNLSTGALSVTFTTDELGTRTFVGKATETNGAVNFTFEASKVVVVAKEVPSVSSDTRMMSLISLVEQYKGLWLGAEFTDK